MKLLVMVMLLAMSATAIGQTLSAKKGGDKSGKSLTFYPGTYMDTEYRYIDSAGNSVIIQNSLPRGAGYTDPTGRQFQYRIFWTRIINEADVAVTLTINFPADSIAIPAAPGTYLKLLVPADTMALEKETLYDYGATGLKSFLDAGPHKPTSVRRTLRAGEACMFYAVTLFHASALYQDSGRPLRTGLALQEHNFFYRVRGITPALDATWIPCGHMVFGK